MYDTPPYPLEEVYERFYNGVAAIDHGDSFALERLSDIEEAVPRWLKQHKELEHSIPSPSGVMECRLKQYFQARNYEPDQESPIGWQLARILGIVAEPIFLAALSAGGFGVELPDISYPCGKIMRAQPDAEINNEFLLETKTMPNIGYNKLIEASLGIREREIGHLIQCQLYLYAAKKEWCLYFVSPTGAFSVLQMLLRGRKKYGKNYDMPPVYLEFIQKDNDIIEMGLERAEMIANDIKSDEPPMREHSGKEFSTHGGRNKPCSWCLWRSTCNSIPYPNRPEAGIKFVS